MKILYVITGLGLGGAERQVCGLADQLALMGNDVSIVSLTKSLDCNPTNKNVKVLSLNMSRNPLSVILAIRKFQWFINIFSPDVIHSHMFHANIFCRIFKLLLFSDVYLICTAHSTNEGGWFRMFMYRITDQCCHISTNVSVEAVDSFINKKAAAKNRMICVYNGINTDDFIFNKEVGELKRQELSLGKQATILLSVGRLTEPKDYPNLISAFSMLNYEHDDLHLVIIGEGVLRDSLESFCTNLGLSGYIHFLGARHDISSFMSAADVFILSSAWEGFGLVVAEAMACERVVVATNCGGVREVLGDTGFLVPARDSNQLAAAMIEALNLSSEHKVSMGELARRRVLELYSLSSICGKWLEIYNNRFSHSMKNGDN